MVSNMDLPKNDDCAEDIKFYMRVLACLTLEEADSIQQILEWEEEKKRAFLIAKKLYENKI
jgi:hypothetical protein